MELLSGDFALTSSTPAGLANGANRALLGGEVIQFTHAVALGGNQWRLQGLLRGRGGTEAAAMAGHAAGTGFVLLDGRPLALDPARLGPVQSAVIVAQGLADEEPVSASLANPGLTLRPLIPVHPIARPLAGGGLQLGWTRRARGAWTWPDEVEIPLGEQAESYRVGLGPADAPLLAWDVFQPSLTLDSAAMTSLESAHSGASIWVRQVGSFAQSDPLYLTTIA